MPRIATTKFPPKDTPSTVGVEVKVWLTSEQYPAHVGANHFNPVVFDKSSRKA